jgi:hypothetical protein
MQTALVSRGERSLQRRSIGLCTQPYTRLRRAAKVPLDDARDDVLAMM